MTREELQDKITELLPEIRELPDKDLIALIRKVKKQKYDIVIDYSFVDPAFKAVFREWLEYRNKINKRYKSDKSIEKAYKSLVEYSGGNPDVAMEIINQSIKFEYQGFFPLRRQQGNQSRAEQLINAFR